MFAFLVRLCAGILFFRFLFFVFLLMFACFLIVIVFLNRFCDRTLRFCLLIFFINCCSFFCFESTRDLQNLVVGKNERIFRKDKHVFRKEVYGFSTTDLCFSEKLGICK